MRGQASFEFLIVALAFLAVLAVWAGGVVTAQGNANSAMSKMSAKIAADRIAGAANQVYYMGEGNEVVVTLTLVGKVNLDASGNKIKLTTHEATFERDIAVNVRKDASLPSELENKVTLTAVCEENRVLLKGS